MEQKKSLKEYNTFGLDVECASFQKFESTSDLNSMFQNTNFIGSDFLVLGGGSNILFTKNYPGAVLKNEIKGIQLIEENEENIIVEVGGGEIWHEFVLWAINNNYGGIENLSLIPGSVGAAPMQNIGAYGVETKDVVVSLKAFEISSTFEKTFSNAECDFGYRESVFKRELKSKFIISHVRFRLTKPGHHNLNTSYGMIDDELKNNNISNPTIQNISDAVIKIRQSKLPDPKEIGNSGSFFKNPILANSILQKIKAEHPNLPIYKVDEHHSKTAAGWLIDQAGWKGYRDGEFGVHKNQALVLVNYGNAKGADIYDLSNRIIASIKEKFGIELEREVNIY